jgi:outer membrane immunogenic protein
MTPDGAVGGIQTGYRFQYGNFVFGPEAMLDAATIHSSVADPRFAGATRNTNFSGLMDVTGDIGLAFDRVMLYGKGGWALSHISLDATSPASGDVKGNQFIDGWVAGGGIEYALPSGFTVGIEYNYFGFKPGQGLANTGGGVLAGPCVACNFTNTNVQTIMARLNVRVGPAP